MAAAAATSAYLTPLSKTSHPLLSSKPTAPAALPLSLSSTFNSSMSVLLSCSSSNILRMGRVVVAPKVAVQPGYELDEDEMVGGDDGASGFSPELKLFVGNLPFSVDSAGLAALFERAGNVQMVEVIYDKMTGKSRGFGFVTMSTAEEVEAAAEQFNGYELNGRALRVNYGPPPPRDEFTSRGSRSGANFDSSNKLYVGNLPWSCDNLALEALFSEQGKVMEAKVVFDRDSGRSRGFGFVTYSSMEEANSAISFLNGFDFDGRPIRVTMAESRPRRQF